jgi:hypothetical protein
MINFQDGKVTEIKHFNTSEVLQSHFEGNNTREFITKNTEVVRRLYVLEDLGRANVEILGSQLGIPPSFFAAHWVLPGYRIATVDEFSVVPDRHECFRILYPELHHIDPGTEEGDNPLGIYTDSENNVPRVLQLLDMDRQFHSSQHQMSYWSTRLLKESWIGKFPNSYLYPICLTNK